MADGQQEKTEKTEKTEMMEKTEMIKCGVPGIRGDRRPAPGT